jgi:hypothetical protein
VALAAPLSSPLAGYPGLLRLVRPAVGGDHSRLKMYRMFPGRSSVFALSLFSPISGCCFGDSAERARTSRTMYPYRKDNACTYTSPPNPALVASDPESSQPRLPRISTPK